MSPNGRPGARQSGEAARRCRMGNCWSGSSPPSPICRPTATRASGLVLRRDAIAEGRAPVNRKVYRVMRIHGLLLLGHAGGADERRHDGKIAVAQSNQRWCSDGFEITCDDAEKVRVAFALDC